MREYILRRLVSMVPVLFLVSIISFALLYVLPGDPALAILGDTGDSARYQALRAELRARSAALHAVRELARADPPRRPREVDPDRRAGLGRARAACPVSLYFGFAGLLFGVAIGLPAADHLGGAAGQQARHARHVHGARRRGHPELLAGAALHVRVRGGAALAAAQRLHLAVCGPVAERQDAVHAGGGARDALGGRHHAPGALGADRGAGAGLHQHRPLQGAAREGRHRHARDSRTR